MSTDLNSIFEAIKRERNFQDVKYGKNRKHDIPAWLVIMEAELEEAKEAWRKKTNAEAIKELLQTICVGIACLEQHGISERSVEEIRSSLQVRNAFDLLNMCDNETAVAAGHTTVALLVKNDLPKVISDLKRNNLSAADLSICIEEIGRHLDLNGAPLLLEFLDHPEPIVREATLYALGPFIDNNKDIEQKFVRLRYHDPSQDVQFTADTLLWRFAFAY